MRDYEVGDMVIRTSTGKKYIVDSIRPAVSSDEKMIVIKQLDGTLVSGGWYSWRFKNCYQERERGCEYCSSLCKSEEPCSLHSGGMI